MIIKMRIFFKLLFFSSCYVVICYQNGNQIMRSVGETFGRTVHECRDEMKFDPTKLGVVFKYWHQHQPFEDREVGCMFRCILQKLELVDERGKLHDANADGFFKANGADDVMTNRLIEIYHYCYQNIPKSQDNCMLILEMGNCCREGVRNAHWSPVK